jgi:hypothetical protein
LQIGADGDISEEGQSAQCLKEGLLEIVGIEVPSACIPSYVQNISISSTLLSFSRVQKALMNYF